MNVRNSIATSLTILVLAVSPVSHAGEHPKLIMTKAGIERIRAESGAVPLFDATVQEVKAEVDAEIALGIDIPIPKDYSGGYTHERHKRNFFIAQKAGVLYQILEDEKYANYVRDMLFQYEAMYEDLPLHPKERSYARGKLFWQCLNDSNWLVYMSQAYDAIFDFLSAEEREQLERNLFRPFADHISIDNPQFFNRVHNHSTWGNAAVGMIGLVMGDEELVERALYGIPFDEIDASAKGRRWRLHLFERREGRVFREPRGAVFAGRLLHRRAVLPTLRNVPVPDFCAGPAQREAGTRYFRAAGRCAAQRR